MATRCDQMSGPRPYDNDLSSELELVNNILVKKEQELERVRLLLERERKLNRALLKRKMSAPRESSKSTAKGSASQ